MPANRPRWDPARAADDPDRRRANGRAVPRVSPAIPTRRAVLRTCDRLTCLRILSFTGGAGPMYCGSCLRDNALASALIARGHDVVLTPVYTPTRTDERNVSQHHVVFGGISVFLEQHSSFFRHTPRVLDRLWDA